MRDLVFEIRRGGSMGVGVGVGVGVPVSYAYVAH